MVKNETYDVMRDIVFKCIFGKKGNEKITKKFLEDILGEDLESVTVDWKLELNRDAIDDKLMVTDIIAKDNEFRKYIIEMQRKSGKYLLRRFLGYTDKVYIADIKVGEKYEVLKKTTLIVIMEQTMKGLPKHDEYHTIISLKTDRNERVLEDTEEIHIIELNKYKERADKTKIEPWLEFIINPNGKEVKEMARTMKELQEAVDQYLLLQADDDVRQLANAQIFASMDRASELAEEREEAKIEGQTKEKRKMAEKLLKRGTDINTIMDLTELSEKEIEKIKKELIRL